MQYLVGDFKVEQSSSTLDAEPISVMHPELPTIPEWQYFFLPDLFSCPAKSVPLYQNLTLDSLTCYVVGRVCSRQQTDNVLVPSKLTSQIRSFCRSLVSRVIVLLSPLPQLLQTVYKCIRSLLFTKVQGRVKYMRMKRQQV